MRRASRWVVLDSSRTAKVVRRAEPYGRRQGRCVARKGGVSVMPCVPDDLKSEINLNSVEQRTG